MMQMMLWDCIHVPVTEEREREGENFECMACGVRITIFSAAPPPHCSITIYCREREREGGRGGGGGGNGDDRRGGGGGELLSDAGDEGSRCERVGENRVQKRRKSDRGGEKAEDIG